MCFYYCCWYGFRFYNLVVAVSVIIFYVILKNRKFLSILIHSHKSGKVFLKVAYEGMVAFRSISLAVGLAVLCKYGAVQSDLSSSSSISVNLF